jgi:hypothetical protein
MASTPLNHRMGDNLPLSSKGASFMGNILLIKIKSLGKVKAIDAIQVSEKPDHSGGLIKHHMFDVNKNSWNIDSSEMVDELRAWVIICANKLNEAIEADASIGPNSLQYKFYKSVIDHIKNVYSNKDVDRVSYLVQSEELLDSNQLPTMQWVEVER